MGSISYTEEQRSCIEQLTGPVDISAGAGSGKTFTLSQRIAYALSPESGSDITSIDQVLAITFTDKAASEIKSRVRSTLRSRGLFDDALRVDSAWISTIHGMCSRILRAHALELGLDPSFEVIDDRVRQELLDEAINEVIGADSEIVSRPEFDALFEAFPARAAGFGGTSVVSMVERIIALAAGMVDGFGGFRMPPAAAAPEELAKRLLLAYETIDAAYAGAKQSATLEKNRAKMATAREALQDFLLMNPGGSAADQKRSAADERPYDAFIAVLDHCDFLSKIRGALADESEDYQNTHAGIAQEAFLGNTRPLLDELMELSNRVQREYDVKKRCRGVLDNDDLLKYALAALSDETIAQTYRDRFRLVMVDEFQDTSQLQIEIVRKLAGPGLRYLCTVGDAQQSIYRFRGADVNVYNAFRSDLTDPAIAEDGGKATMLELTSNFRSHADVLSLVRTICSQEQVFGDGFLDLKAVYGGGGYRAVEPRIQLVAATVPAGMKGTTADIVDGEARAIAQYFTRMHEAGHPLSDMAVLLGRMSYAEVYAQAIRDAGFPCIIAGGSLFHKAHEVRVVERLLRVLADINDTQALFEVLTSDMFELSVDEMLELATGFDETNGIPLKRDLSKGFMVLFGCIDELSTGLRHAVSLMAKAQQEVRFVRPSEALMDILLDSGWISRLEQGGAEGSACCANILKAVRFVEAMEQDRQFGISRCSAEFSSMIAAGMKEAPGALSADGQEAVRIMTIHASKGLEFPLVALARFARGSAGPSDRLLAETMGSETYLSLSTPSTLLDKGSLSVKAQAKPHVEPVSADPRSVGGLIGYHTALKRIAREEEEAEEKRLFYVGATRAKESLAIVAGFKEQKTDPLKAYRGTIDDIRAALFGAEPFPQDDADVEYGGSEPARFTRIVVASGDGDRVGDGEAEAENNGDSALCQRVGSCVDGEDLGSVAVPAVEPFALPMTVTPSRAPTGLFSYSSIAELQSADVSAPAAERRAVDVDKATDFGSAFHRVAQLAATRSVAFARDRLEVIAATYGIKDMDRLDRAVGRWFDSAVCARALAMSVRSAEVPFCVAVADGFLEGEIDLLCTDDGRHAFVVDYKTGGSVTETDAQLHEKHVLQAQCYAYAILQQGFESAEFAFVRVERDDPRGSDTLQVVPYRFEYADRDTLGAVIASRAEETRVLTSG